MNDNFYRSGDDKYQPRSTR